jgi:hypothetical protein
MSNHSRGTCRHLVTLALCLALLPSLFGCTALVAGGTAAGATYVYVEGWVQRDYAVGLEQAYAAASEAADKLRMTIEERSREVSSASIKGRIGDETHWIKLEEKAPDRTTVSVRSGIVGDRVASEKIHEAIQRAL